MATEPLSAKQQRPLVQQGFELEVLSGPDAGKRAVVLEACTVGNDPDCTFPLADGAVSRRHVAITIDRHGAEVRDLGSTNGTLLAGLRTEQFRVNDSVNFRVGRTVLQLRARVPDRPKVERFGQAVTASDTMRRVFAALRQAARGPATVLLSGETGTGKEVLARALHGESARSHGPFVVVDCARLTGEVVEAELFGHVKGSFTGATSDRRGLLAEADGGTVFFDELGELPLPLQTRLLRFLTDKQVRPVGANTAEAVDVRVVSATHRDLRQQVDQGLFRADLYYRLAGVVIEVPPLRARVNDLELLFGELLGREGKRDFLPTPELLAHLHGHRWPGNVRELNNFVLRVLSGVDEVEPSPALGARGFKQTKDGLLEAFTRQYFVQLYESCGGNVSEVARVAGLARPWVHELLKRLGIHGG